MDPRAFTRTVGVLMKRILIVSLCLTGLFLGSCKMIGGSSQPYLAYSEIEVR